MSELKEGMDALAEQRLAKRRVYLVFLDRYDNYSFRDVFFTQEAAELFISQTSHPRRYTIEIFEETDNGKSKEIY
jgi:hypothetical protein